MVRRERKEGVFTCVCVCVDIRKEETATRMRIKDKSKLKLVLSRTKVERDKLRIPCILMDLRIMQCGIRMDQRRDPETNHQVSDELVRHRTNSRSYFRRPH